MLTIATFNIQNDYGKDISKNGQIIDFILSNKIDIIGIQELFKSTGKSFEVRLEQENYKIMGKYRYKLPILKKYNEKTPIITNKTVVENKTYYLPFFPSFTRRVLTKTVITYNNKLLSIYNTHLECKMAFVKKRQLEKILNIMKRDSNNIVLLGDFNLKTNKELFNDFVDELKRLNIYRVSINEKTLKTSKYNRAIDHIFISSDFEVVEKRVIKNINTSDHYPVLVRLVGKKGC